jgi:hypothetical protein
MFSSCSTAEQGKADMDSTCSLRPQHRLCVQQAPCSLTLQSSCSSLHLTVPRCAVKTSKRHWPRPAAVLHPRTSCCCWHCHCHCCCACQHWRGVRPAPARCQYHPPLLTPAAAAVGKVSRRQTAARRECGWVRCPPFPGSLHVPGPSPAPDAPAAAAGVAGRSWCCVLLLA